MAARSPRGSPTPETRSLTTPLVPRPRWTGEILPDPALGLLAFWLAGWCDEGGMPVHVARSERRAQTLLATVRSLAPEIEVLPFPAWDSLPYERAPPSRAIVGRRLRTLRRLAEGSRQARIVIASVEALAQRLAGEPVMSPLTLALGDEPELEELGTWLDAAGYVVDERVDEPGEAALRGSVVDLFPAGAERPRRLELDEGRVVAIRTYDPISQRSLEEVERVTLDPAAEAPGLGGTLLDRLPEDARLVLDGRLDARLDDFLAVVRDAHEARLGLRRSEAAAGGDETLPEPGRLYLDEAAWTAALETRPHVRLEGDPAGEALPRFAVQSRPGAALGAFVRERIEAGDRVILAAADPARQRRLVQPVARAIDATPRELGGWREMTALAAGAVAALAADLPAGFASRGLVIVTAADVLPRRAQRSGSVAAAEALLGVGGLRPGDHVVHARHGIGQLLGLETPATEEVGGEHLVLSYAGDKRLLVPVLELDQVWRYGTAESRPPLDRIDGEDWPERRDRIAAEVDAAAVELQRRAEQRRQTIAPALRPPREAMARVVRRFPYEPSEDQAVAIEAVLADLARESPPMDRLVCGDVGFGKTEVALRAVAAAALSGRQAALIAPTTLLAQQHLQTFRRRFAGLGLRVEGLSRQARSAEARVVREGLADGSVQVVIGTHALTGPQIEFADLALVVIDEEQRFGAEQKEALRRLGEGVHILAMTATPIPRTLQSALAGIRELSIIATPPVRRRPVRTFVLSYEPALVREALERERRRGGRSFVVAPRIADLEPLRERLKEAAPGFDIAVAHGRMRADKLDAALLAFANGEHDVLLATSIIETGLDIPGADTMIVWDAQRFGVAELHQLRGRVGRGRERAVCYLLSDPEEGLTPAAEQRLRTLSAFEDLGAGFLISARDLDLRGAGDLAGADQSGHLKLIGAGLYQDLLARALRRARGEPVEDDWSPEIQLGIGPVLPADYVPEPELRLDLYGRAARSTAPDEAQELGEEIADRFGPLPEAVVEFLRLAELRARCRRLGVARLEVGPKAAAATLRAPSDIEVAGLKRSGERLVLEQPSETPAERLAAAAALLDALDAA